VSVVVITRDRRARVLRTLDCLCALPEQPAVIVVDNASCDGTVRAVRDAHPGVRVLPLTKNLGATARNIGVLAARAPYVAFADDDSWWAPGALSAAADVFDANPRLGLVAARVLVGDEARLDPVSSVMAASPLPRDDDAPGPPVLGFVACGAVVRRRAFIEAGGFDDILFFFGEEQLLALDMARAGWQLAYVDDVVAHHHPSAGDGRTALALRNDVLSAWLRRPLGVALRATRSLVRASFVDRDHRSALAGVVRRLPAALVHRAVVPPELEQRVRLLEASA